MRSNLAISSDWLENVTDTTTDNEYTLSGRGDAVLEATPGPTIRVSGQVPDWFHAARRTMVELLGLPENWDSYGAQPVKPESVLFALEFLLSTTNEKVPEPSIVPISNGGLQIEWHTHGLDLEVEFEPTGHGHVTYENRDQGTEWEDELPHARGYLPDELVECLRELAQRS